MRAAGSRTWKTAAPVDVWSLLPEPGHESSKNCSFFKSRARQFGNDVIDVSPLLINIYFSRVTFFFFFTPPRKEELQGLMGRRWQRHPQINSSANQSIPFPSQWEALTIIKNPDLGRTPLIRQFTSPEAPSNLNYSLIIRKA